MTRGRGIALATVALALALAFASYGGPAIQIALFDLAGLFP